MLFVSLWHMQYVFKGPNHEILTILPSWNTQEKHAKMPKIILYKHTDTDPIPLEPPLVTSMLAKYH